jgi:hypothetical protein
MHMMKYYLISAIDSFVNLLYIHGLSHPIELSYFLLTEKYLITFPCQMIEKGNIYAVISSFLVPTRFGT